MLSQLLCQPCFIHGVFIGDWIRPILLERSMISYLISTTIGPTSLQIRSGPLNIGSFCWRQMTSRKQRQHWYFLLSQLLCQPCFIHGVFIGDWIRPILLERSMITTIDPTSLQIRSGPLNIGSFCWRQMMSRKQRQHSFPASLSAMLHPRCLYR
jgi:hypothetical protein